MSSRVVDLTSFCEPAIGILRLLFTNNELLVSMNTENLTLYDKICQMKTLQEIVMSLNNLTKLDISLKENNIIYKYKNDSSKIEVIETINL